jgi:head-tail adaptor
MPRIGQLRQRVSFTDPSTATSSQNTFGEDAGDEREVGPFPAMVATLSGREFFQVSQRWADARYKVTIRHQPGVTFTRQMYITWGDQTLDILDIQDVPENRHHHLTMICKDHVA